MRRTSCRGSACSFGNGSNPKLPGAGASGGTNSPRRTSGRGNECSGAIAGGVNTGGRTTSLGNKDGGVFVSGSLKLAPGSGLNGVRGGAFVATETARDQFVAGGKFVDRIKTFGSGLNSVGAFGGGPGLIT